MTAENWGQLVSLGAAIGFYWGAIKVQNWIAEVILFLVSLGAAATAMSFFHLPLAAVFWVYTAMLGFAGFRFNQTAARLKKSGEKSTGVRVVAVVTILLAIIVAAAAIDQTWGSGTSGNILNQVLAFLEKGWTAILGFVQSFFGHFSS